jgi:hypothetical protein
MDQSKPRFAFGANLRRRGPPQTITNPKMTSAYPLSIYLKSGIP